MPCHQVGHAVGVEKEHADDRRHEVEIAQPDHNERDRCRQQHGHTRFGCTAQGRAQSARHHSVKRQRLQDAWRGDHAAQRGRKRRCPDADQHQNRPEAMRVMIRLLAISSAACRADEPDRRWQGRSQP